MKLIWHADNLLEVDWLRNVLGNLVEEECTDLDLTCFDDDCIHVVSSNWRPLPAYENYFRECRARCRRLVLMHLSDEWFSGGYALYRHFDAVIRNFATDLARHQGIWTIPEGYANGTRTPGSVRPVTERPYVWSFTGEIKASRVDMAEAFAPLKPNFLAGTTSIYQRGGRKLSKAEFDDVLENTVFSPCPMGNVILETWRLYESLELGCIPIIETRATLDYFTGLWGPHPSRHSGAGTQPITTPNAPSPTNPVCCANSRTSRAGGRPRRNKFEGKCARRPPVPRIGPRCKAMARSLATATPCCMSRCVSENFCATRPVPH